MIDLYYWTTPNGHKITLFLEETGLPYAIHPINISQGDQFQADFLKVSPNNKIPAIVDRQPADGGAPCRCSSPAPSCSISRKRPDGSSPRTCARARKPCSGCSGRWAGWGRWPGRTTISTASPRRRFLRHRPVRQGNRAPVRRSRPAPGGPRLRRRRRLQHRRHGHLSVDRPTSVAGAGSRRLPTPAALVREHSPASGDATRLCFGGAHQSAAVAGPEPACGRPRGRSQAELAQPCAPH